MIDLESIVYYLSFNKINSFNLNLFTQAIILFAIIYLFLIIIAVILNSNSISPYSYNYPAILILELFIVYASKMSDLYSISNTI